LAILQQKYDFLSFWAPFWIMRPSWISTSKLNRLKMFFGSIYSTFHIKKEFKSFLIGGIPVNFLVKKYSLYPILGFWPPYWIFLAIPDFCNEIRSFLKIKPLKFCKNVQPLIYCYLLKIGQLKSAILVQAVILDYFKKKNPWFVCILRLNKT
jgi:hypothetical protein